MGERIQLCSSCSEFGTKGHMLSEEIEYLVYLCREDGDATSPMSMNAKAHSLRPSSLLS